MGEGEKGLPKQERPQKRRGASVTSRGITMGNTGRGGLKADQILSVLRDAAASDMTLAEFLKKKSDDSSVENK